MKIVWQIRWFSILLVLTTALLIGAIVFYGYRRIASYQQEASLRQIQAAGAIALQNELNALVDNIVLTAMIPSVKEVLRDGGAGDHEDALHAIEQIFTTSIRTRKYFDQVRLIGVESNGKEVVRVDRENGNIEIVAPDALQEKGSRYYFEETIKLAAGEIFLSEIDLNREFGKIEVPHKPMLRIATPVIGREGAPLGIVVFNIRFNDLVSSVLHDETTAYQFLITNQQGDYLLHPDEERRFGFEFEQRYLIQDDYPSVRSLLESSESFPVLTIGGRQQNLVIGGFDLLPQRHDRRVLLGVSTTDVAVSDSQASVIQWATVATGILVLASLVVAYMTTNFLTRPLQQITLAAKNIRGRNSVEMLPVQRDDEIGTLARAFETMVTEIKQTESSLRKTNLRLVEANQDLEHFTHLAAHDLREPLRKQLNLLGLLREQFPVVVEEPMSFFVGRIEQCSDQMYRMVDDFRRLTRLSGGELTREPVDFDKIIDDVLLSFEEQLKRRNVSLSRDEFPLGLSGYPSLLEWLYNNLISNALRYVDRDGFEIAFTAEQVEGSGWVFGVRNTGSTIPTDQLHEIFKMFRKADSGKADASGIGLSLCRRIVDKHSGKIFAESGADFTHLKFTLKKDDSRVPNSERQ